WLLCAARRPPDDDSCSQSTARLQLSSTWRLAGGRQSQAETLPSDPGPPFMGTFLVVLFLLAVCGLIAYIGDLLGRRMGKKRLTVFGLRPKHTAILFTVLTGILIACVSLGAAFGVSPGVRIALTQGEKLVLKDAALRGSGGSG